MNIEEYIQQKKWALLADYDTACGTYGEESHTPYLMEMVDDKSKRNNDEWECFMEFVVDQYKEDNDPVKLGVRG